MARCCRHLPAAAGVVATVAGMNLVIAIATGVLTAAAFTVPVARWARTASGQQPVDTAADAERALVATVAADASAGARLEADSAALAAAGVAAETLTVDDAVALPYHRETLARVVGEGATEGDRDEFGGAALTPTSGIEDLPGDRRLLERSLLGAALAAVLLSAATGWLTGVVAAAAASVVVGAAVAVRTVLLARRREAALTDWDRMIAALASAKLERVGHHGAATLDLDADEPRWQPPAPSRARYGATFGALALLLSGGWALTVLTGGGTAWVVLAALTVLVLSPTLVVLGLVDYDTCYADPVTLLVGGGVALLLAGMGAFLEGGAAALGTTVAAAAAVVGFFIVFPRVYGWIRGLERAWGGGDTQVLAVSGAVAALLAGHPLAVLGTVVGGGLLGLLVVGPWRAVLWVRGQRETTRLPLLPVLGAGWLPGWAAVLMLEGTRWLV